MVDAFVTRTFWDQLSPWIGCACFLWLTVISYRKNPSKRHWILCLIAASCFATLGIFGI